MQPPQPLSSELFFTNKDNFDHFQGCYTPPPPRPGQIDGNNYSDISGCNPLSKMLMLRVYVLFLLFFFFILFCFACLGFFFFFFFFVSNMLRVSVSGHCKEEA